MSSQQDGRRHSSAHREHRGSLGAVVMAVLWAGACGVAPTYSRGPGMGGSTASGAAGTEVPGAGGGPTGTGGAGAGFGGAVGASASGGSINTDRTPGGNVDNTGGQVG